MSKSIFTHFFAPPTWADIERQQQAIERQQQAQAAAEQERVREELMERERRLETINTKNNQFNYKVVLPILSVTGLLILFALNEMMKLENTASREHKCEHNPPSDNVNYFGDCVWTPFVTKVYPTLAAAVTMGLGWKMFKRKPLDQLDLLLSDRAERNRARGN